MQIGKTLYVTKRKKWREWLAKNHDKKNEIWLIYNKKASGKARIDYNHAVEEALCFGWIDSTVKSIDEQKYAQRFSPRRKKSHLSQMNKERVRALIKQKKMTKAGLAAIAHVYNPKTDTPKKPKLPVYIENALKVDKKAWDNWQKFPDSYKRMRIAYVKSQKKHNSETGKAAVRNLVKMTAKGKRFGFVKE